MTPQPHRFGPADGFPNNPDLPVLFYPAAFPDGDAEERLGANGWNDIWRWTIYDFHHFHPESHEALACVEGRGEIMVGGPSGATLVLTPGDLIVLPAGTAHCRVSASADFAVVGAYPPWQGSPDILRAGDVDAAILRAIAATPVPETDPATGAPSPLPELWRASRG